MKYLTTKEAALKWHISQRRVIRLAGEGRLAGAYRFGNRWMIPEDMKKPRDGRVREAQGEPAEEKGSFRFPFFMNEREESFTPPLSSEEAKLRRAQLDFLACAFPDAEKAFTELWKSGSTPYIRIMALVFLCQLAVCYREGKDFAAYFTHFNLALAEDFPHKTEMELLRPWLYCYLVQYANAADCLNLPPDYAFAPSACSLASLLSFCIKTSVNSPEVDLGVLNCLEMHCKQAERLGSYYEEQYMHLSLFMAYFFLADKKALQVHLRRALRIAYERNLLFPVADAYSLYEEDFEEELGHYPADFAERLRFYGKQVGHSFAVFSKEQKHIGFYAALSRTDYRYVFYAMQGHSYKQVAGLMNLSMRTIANRYAEIYEKLGVRGKQELMEYMNHTMFKPRDGG